MRKYETWISLSTNMKRSYVFLFIRYNAMLIWYIMFYILDNRLLQVF
jgi:hypothetical protein